MSSMVNVAVVARGVAAVVRRSERDRRCASRTAIGAQRVEVVRSTSRRRKRPSPTRRRCWRAKHREVSAVARTVAFDRRVHAAVHRTAGAVVSSIVNVAVVARGVAAVVRRSEGHRRRTRSTAIGAQRVEVVRSTSRRRKRPSPTRRRCWRAKRREVGCCCQRRRIQPSRPSPSSHCIWSRRVFDRERRRSRSWRCRSRPSQ